MKTWFKATVMASCMTAVALPAGAVQAPQRPNPFAAESNLPFHAPRFDIIQDADYQPAFEAGMAEQAAEIARIANNPAPPSFENTIVAMERSGRMLDRVNEAFSGVVGANTNPALDKVQEIETPKLSQHQDAIYLNPKLFARVQSVYDRRAKLGLNPEQKQ
ncbi:MAG TPA: dipeptidyl carboxypeptidase II, partial [Allosphingosinicella sp.]|nr:dipeptidyl carboxypeptidase II [Allosphingosinicella sp.]